MSKLSGEFMLGPEPIAPLLKMLPDLNDQI
jgi:hypothetical protein